MIVMKFGGSSLASAEKIRRCAGLVAAEIGRRPAVVVSACGKTTNGLVRAAERALAGEVDGEEIRAYHRALVAELGLEPGLVDPLLDELAAYLRGVQLLRELTARSRDRILSYGELLSARIFARALASTGVPARDAAAWDLGLFTDSEHGCAAPLPGIEEEIDRRLRAVDAVPVITGFLGADRRGEITTLGRSGSDYSASIFAAAAGADEVQIWTDVSGVMTCDPTLDARARNLPRLSFDEASELAYYGAEVLHPNTLVPAIRAGIPVRVKNTLRPDDPGTVITASSAVTDRLAKSVVYKERVCLIDLASPRLMSAVRLLSAAFEVLRRRRIGIHMAATSEATVSMVTDRHYEPDALEPALAELRALGRVTAEPEQAIVCVVGEELHGRAGVLGTIFGAVAARGIKPRMVSQSASELNVAFLVAEEEIEQAVLAVHELLLDA